jgi:hypothetical protein
MKQE